MLLAIDVGNTNITFGVFAAAAKPKRVFSIPTKEYDIKKLRRLLGRTALTSSIICSVVPKINPLLAKDLRSLTGRKPYIIGKEIKVPIKNCYRKPRQVGADRLVNAFAGINIYGRPLIVIDFGTAITFDIVSRRGEYLGGMILPGLRISLEALNQKTALLPKISLAKPDEFIGRDTKNSMLSGIIYGYASLTDDLIKRIKLEIGRKAKVIATGGNIDLISEYCTEIDDKDINLTLKGLEMLYRYRSSSDHKTLPKTSS
jgi:type III pantothenate kinase